MDVYNWGGMEQRSGAVCCCSRSRAYFLLIGCRCRNGIASEVRHPNFCTIESHREWTFAGGVSCYDGPTRGAHFCYGAVSVANHPQTVSIEQDPRSSISDLESSEIETIAGAQFGH